MTHQPTGVPVTRHCRQPGAQLWAFSRRVECPKGKATGLGSDRYRSRFGLSHQFSLAFSQFLKQASWSPNTFCTKSRRGASHTCSKCKFRSKGSLPSKVSISQACGTSGVSRSLPGPATELPAHGSGSSAACASGSGRVALEQVFARDSSTGRGRVRTAGSQAPQELADKLAGETSNPHTHTEPWNSQVVSLNTDSSLLKHTVDSTGLTFSPSKGVITSRGSGPKDRGVADRVQRSSPH